MTVLAPSNSMMLRFQSPQKLVARPLSSRCQAVFKDCAPKSLCLPAHLKMAKCGLAASHGCMKEEPWLLGRLALQEALGQCTQLVFMILPEVKERDAELEAILVMGIKVRYGT